LISVDSLLSGSWAQKSSTPRREQQTITAQGLLKEPNTMTRRSRRRVALAATTAALIAAGPLVFAEPAFAQYPPGSPPQLGDDAVAPGEELTFSATGFEPNEDVDVSLVPDGAAAAGAATAALRTSPSFVQPIVSPTAEGEDGDDHGDGDGDRDTVPLGTFTADASGAVSGTVTIPEDTPPGDYRFTLEGQESGTTLSAPLTVTGDGDDDGDDHGDDHGRPGDGDDHGDDHGRPGDGDHHGDDHGSGHGNGDDHGSGHGNGDDHGSGHGNGSSGHDPSELAKTGSSDASVALLSAAGALALLGGGSLVIVKRRRSHSDRG
jgi:LPXTG-motif cell wall-anchored protein